MPFPWVYTQQLKNVVHARPSYHFFPAPLKSCVPAPSEEHSTQHTPTFFLRSFRSSFQCRMLGEAFPGTVFKTVPSALSSYFFWHSLSLDMRMALCCTSSSDVTCQVPTGPVSPASHCHRVLYFPHDHHHLTQDTLVYFSSPFSH